MSNGIAVYLRAQDLPDGEWLGRLVASMEPAFAFAEGFDPENDDGWVPCRIGETECGFEWEFGEIESLPAELEGRRFDRVAGLHWRSDANDAICAVLVAANLAHVAHGVLGVAVQHEERAARLGRRPAVGGQPLPVVAREFEP